VIEEMDNQKRHHNKRVAATARQALSATFGSSPREPSGSRRLNPRVTIEILLDDQTHVRLPVNDTEIVDRAAYLHDLFAAHRLVYLVAGDLQHVVPQRGAGASAHPGR
jgi:hypothetical protein